jgi:hypothetical protein
MLVYKRSCALKRNIFVLAISVSISALLAAAWPSAGADQEKARQRPLAERRNRPTADRAAAGVASAVAGWTAAVDISNTAAESRAPVIDLDARGNAYVIWQDWPVFYGAGGPRQTMFNTNMTGQWQSAATLIHDQLYISIDDSGFPTVAVNPSGTKIIVAYHDGDFAARLMQVFYREWSNGSWGEDYLNFSQAPAPCEYPAIAFSPLDDTIFGLFMADVGTPFELAMRYRDGVTGTWSSPELTNILSGRSKYLYLTKQMKFDPSGVLHTVFTTHTQAWYAKNATPKDPNTWSPAFNLSGETGLTDTDPRLAVDNAGEAYAVWQQMIGGNQEIMFRKTVGGVWQPAENISQTPNPSEIPTIAVNRATGDLFVAWQEYLPGNAEVFLKSYELQPGSTAKSWSENINVTNSPGPSGEPYLNSDVSGNIYLVYVDLPPGAAKLEIMYMVRQSGPRPPVNMALTTSLDASETRKVNTLTWEANPDNTNYTIASYKIYRSEGGADFGLLATVPASTLQYQDTNLEPGTIYAYRMTSVADDGREGQSSAIIDDNKNFQLPPVRIALTLAFNKILFSQENYVTITFAPNPLNKDTTVAGYEIYRRKVGESDDRFGLLASLNATTFTYTYVVRPPDSTAQKFAYALKTVFKSGTKSDLSTIVAEQ